MRIKISEILDYISEFGLSCYFWTRTVYSKTPIYHRPWEHGKGGGKSGAAVNRDFPFLSP
jgi:hypothetical protein